MEPRRRSKWRRVRRAALYGFLPMLLGIGLLAAAFHRRAPLDVQTETPAKLRGIPWEQQVYWMEVGFGSVLLFGGCLATIAIATDRRG